jgi:hypothetical protein
VVVDPARPGNLSKKAERAPLELVRRQTHLESSGTRILRTFGLHRKMAKNLHSVSSGSLGNLPRVPLTRKHRHRDRLGKATYPLELAEIPTEIVDD